MTEAFTWGPGGQAETTSSRSRRRLAEALMQEGTSTAPIQSVWQGLNRVAAALMGGYDLRKEDERELRQEQQANEIMAAHPAFAGVNASPTPMAAAPTSGVSKVARVLTGMPITDYETGSDGTKIPIYGNSTDPVPSPLDPPSGRDRDLAIRTIVGEAADQGPVGMQAVASVIRNRAASGGYGGNTPAEVVLAPNQFEPWNGGPARDRMLALQPTDPRYIQAGQAVDRAYTGMDPTNGAVNFIQPTLQTALGRPMPQWAQQSGTMIGDHKFIGGAPVQTAQVDPAALPPNAQPTQGYAIPGQQAAGISPGMQPQIPPRIASWARGALQNPMTRSTALGVLSQYSKPRETYTQETDDQGNIWSVNQQTGQRTVALKAERGEEAGRPITPQERAAYGIPEGTPVIMTSKGPKAIGGGGTTVNNNMGGGSDKQIFDEMVERAKAARATAQGLTGIRNAREAIEGGAITGFNADNRLMLQKAAKYFGIPVGDASKIENSETFKSAIAPQVAAVLKSTVGNANISDSDRRFAERAAGGSLDLDETSIKRLLDIMERASTSALEQHQETLDALYPDPEKHKRERSLFGVRVTPGGKPSGATSSGVKWSVD